MVYDPTSPSEEELHFPGLPSWVRPEHLELMEGDIESNRDLSPHVRASLLGMVRALASGDMSHLVPPETPEQRRRRIPALPRRHPLDLDRIVVRMKPRDFKFRLPKLGDPFRLKDHEWVPEVKCKLLEEYGLHSLTTNVPQEQEGHVVFLFDLDHLGRITPEVFRLEMRNGDMYEPEILTDHFDLFGFPRERVAALFKATETIHLEFEPSKARIVEM